MKHIIYKNRVISALLLYLFTLLLVMYLYTHISIYFIWIIMLPIAFLSKKILCILFGHKIITTRNVTDHFKEFKCTVCELELTNDEKGKKTFLKAIEVNDDI